MSNFIIFLEQLETNDNHELIEVIKSGYNTVYEGLSTDDANAKPDGRTLTDFDIKAEFDYLPNSENGYFPQTLPDKFLDVADKATIGSKVGKFPTGGRTVLGADPLKRFDSSQNVNGVGGEYAGGGTGYSLGSP